MKKKRNKYMESGGRVEESGEGWVRKGVANLIINGISSNDFCSTFAKSVKLRTSYVCNK